MAAAGMDIARPQGLRWDQAPAIGIPAEAGYTTLQPVGQDRVRNDQNQGAFRINVYDPSMVDLDTVELLFEVAVESPHVGQSVTVGKSIASLFRKVTMRDPTDNILDEVQEYNHLDAMVSSLNLAGNVRSMQSMQDGSRIVDPIQHILSNPVLVPLTGNPGAAVWPANFSQPGAIGVYNQSRWTYLAPQLKSLTIRPRVWSISNGIETISVGPNATITLTVQQTTAILGQVSNTPTIITLGDRFRLTGSSVANYNVEYTVTNYVITNGRYVLTTTTDTTGFAAFSQADSTTQAFAFYNGLPTQTYKVNVEYYADKTVLFRPEAALTAATIGAAVAAARGVVYDVVDYVYMGGEKKDQVGPVLITGRTVDSAPKYSMAMNLNHLSLMRSGKTFPLSILTGSGLKLDFELARSQQCLIGPAISESVVIHLRNIRLRMRRQTFQDSFNVATNAMILERGSISMPSTKWICSHGQLAQGQNRIIVSQTASSIKFMMLAIVPEYEGSNGATEYHKNPFIRSVANVASYQIYLGGKEIPSQAIIVADSQANTYEEVVGQDAQSYRYWNGKQAIFEYFTAVQKTADKDFDCLLQPETWGVNHFNAQGARVASLPAGSMIFAVSLEPYKTHGLRSVGVNTSQNGVPLEVRLSGNGRVIPSFHYVTALLVDSMNIVTAGGGMQSVY